MQSKTILNLDLGENSYDIVIGQNILSDTANYIKQVANHSHFIIVTDENIPQKYSQQIVDSLGKHNKIEIITIPAGESSKSFYQLEELLNSIFATTPERNVTLIALGGGVIGDLTGFAASILLRGVNFIQIPTTILSQVDSSVGGKTGINNKFGKNLIGSFYQPKLVLIDIDSLDSLPHREFLAGYAEVVKYGLIDDAEFFTWLDDNIEDILKKDKEKISYIIEKSCNAKAKIVQEDEKEKGRRALLNLGHTFGHALEQQCGYDGSLLHGEAVAIGMVMAMQLSYKVGSLQDESQIEMVINHLKKAGLPTSPLDIKRNWDIDQLIKIMGQDKKVLKGKTIFILNKSIGESYIDKNIDGQDVRDLLNQILIQS